MHAEQEFVVTVNRDQIAQARKQALAKLNSFGAVMMVLGAVIAGFAPVYFVMSNNRGAIMIGIVGLVVLWFGFIRLIMGGRLSRSWERIGISPVAMRIGPAGLRCSIDAAPDSIFLPWHTVARVWLFRRGGRENIVLDLAPGTTPQTAGVAGLEQSEVQRILHTKVLGITGLRYAVSTLEQSVPAISQAMFQASGSRVWIS
ncbi:MAG: hypothetical protein ACRDQZ_03960 [Mycobacteriales bacterium]